MSEIKVGAWNARQSFESDQSATAVIEELDADIVMVSEAYKLDVPAVEAGVRYELGRRLGYDVYPFNREPEEQDRRQVASLFLSRVALSECEIIDIGSRRAAKATVEESGLQIVGAHLDDRNETSRVVSVKDMVTSVRANDPTMLLGDFNLMHGDSYLARFLRSPVVGAVARHIPFNRAQSLATRLVEMADGSAMNFLKLTGFEDVDTDHRPTIGVFGGRIPVAQLDYIMANRQVGAVNDFRHARNKGASDHVPISALVEM